jgi:hypothetical protein
MLAGTKEPHPGVQPLGASALHGPPLEKHIVVVLGVGPGLGLAIARIFAKQGYTTAILSRSKERLDGWAKEVSLSLEHPECYREILPLIFINCALLSFIRRYRGRGKLRRRRRNRWHLRAMSCLMSRSRAPLPMFKRLGRTRRLELRSTMQVCEREAHFLNRDPSRSETEFRPACV